MSAVEQGEGAVVGGENNSDPNVKFKKCRKRQKQYVRENKENLIVNDKLYHEHSRCDRTN